MARRATTLNNYTSTAITREIDSKYDVVKSVSEKLEELEKISDAIDDGSFEDATNIVNMEVVTGAEGTEATWDGTTLTIPKGDQGIQGIQGDDGYTPVKGVDYVDGINGADGVIPELEFSYNATTGDLEYNVVGYLTLDTTLKEW